MASLSSHPFYNDLDEVMDKVSAAGWELNHVATVRPDAGRWRARVRKLADAQLDILRQLDDIQHEFAQAFQEE